MALGGKHSLILTNKGHMYACGFGSQGQLGLGTTDNKYTPCIVQSMLGKKVIMVAAGTGIGSALFHNGILFPNTELGHLKFKDSTAEKYAANSVRKKQDLSWEKWGKRFNKYLNHLDFLFWSELIIMGGGVSKYHENYFKYFKLRSRVVPAQMRNEAGIIGAALNAQLKES